MVKFIHEEPSTSERWLERAKKNLSLAKHGNKSDDVSYELLCYNCQQAGELSLKALMILKTGKYLTTHSLEELINILEKGNIAIPDEIKNAANSPYFYGGWTIPWTFPWTLGSKSSLSKNAVETRYPGDYQPIDEKGYRNALQKAEVIVSWVEQQIREKN